MCSLRLVYKHITQNAPGSAFIRNFTVVPEVMLLYTDHVYTLVTCTGVNFGHFNPIIGGRTRIEEMEARAVKFPP